MRSLVLILFLAAACTDNESAYRTLREQGYTEIQLDGYSILCEEGASATAFKARNPKGKLETGAVCCGLFGCHLSPFWLNF